MGERRREAGRVCRQPSESMTSAEHPTQEEMAGAGSRAPLVPKSCGGASWKRTEARLRKEEKSGDQRGEEGKGPGKSICSARSGGGMGEKVRSLRLGPLTGIRRGGPRRIPFAPWENPMSSQDTGRVCLPLLTKVAKPGECRFLRCAGVPLLCVCGGSC